MYQGVFGYMFKSLSIVGCSMFSQNRKKCSK